MFSIHGRAGAWGSIEGGSYSFSSRLLAQAVARESEDASGRHACPASPVSCVITVASITDGSALRNMEDVIEHLLLHDLTNDIVSHLRGVFSVRDDDLGPMGKFFLSRPELYVPAFQLLCLAMTSSSATCARHAGSTFVGLLPFLVKIPGMEPVLTGMLLNSALKSLSEHGEHQECKISMLSVLTHVFESFPDPSSTVLMSLPGSTMEKLSSLRQTVRTFPPSCSSTVQFEAHHTHVALQFASAQLFKKKRNAMKSFLGKNIGVSVGQLASRNVKVANIPGTVQVSRELSLLCSVLKSPCVPLPYHRTPHHCTTRQSG